MALGSYTNLPITSGVRDLKHAASVAAALADMLYVSDAANGYVKPAGQIADQGDAEKTQRLFARFFAGLSGSIGSVSDTTARAANIQTDLVITDYPCEAMTCDQGAFFAPTYSAGVLSNQQLTKVTDATRAVAVATRAYTSSTTTVKVRFLARRASAMLPQSPSGGLAFSGKVSAPAAKTTTTTLTAAEILGGLLTASQGAAGAATYTLPTGTLLAAALPSDFAVGDCFDFSVVNISTNAAEIITLSGDTDMTLIGNATVAANGATTSQAWGTWRVRKTAAATFSAYRIG